MPAISGWSSGMQPQPIRVGITGTPVVSANSTRRSQASALMMPPPATISGRSASFSIAMRLLDLAAAGPRLVDRQRLVGVEVELDLGRLDVDRQVDQHRPGPARAHDVEGLLEHARHEARLAHGHRPFGHRLGDRFDVDRLEVLLVELGARRLAGDAQDRQGIGDGGVEAGDHVGAGRARGADADADIAGHRPGVAVGHVRGALDMAGQDVADAAMLAHRGIERVDRRARHAERDRDALALQHAHRRLHGRHLRPCRCLPRFLTDHVAGYHGPNKSATPLEIIPHRGMKPKTAMFTASYGAFANGTGLAAEWPPSSADSSRRRAPPAGPSWPDAPR